MSENQNTNENINQNGKLKRSLKARHLTMIAMGGAIGTGLFVASGEALSTAGPGGALFAYAAIGVMVYFLMTSLGEMATFLPISGSFETYATRFVDPALGFALGWNYWYSWAITVAAELSASALIMRFWFPDVPAIIWSAAFLSILFLLNILSAKIYGESEYWFAGIKVVTVLIFLVIGLLMIFGIISADTARFANLTVGDAPFVNGLSGMIGIFIVAGFSFQGTEIVGVAAGESEKPEVDVPKAINTVFWRILIFYIGAIFVIGCVLPYTDPQLLNGSIDKISVSPFTLVFNKAGFLFAASVMNAVILTSVLSCGNSGMYVATRMLYAMALEKKAPALLAKVNKRGVPMNALYVTTGVGMLAFLASLYGNGTVYIWFLNASGLSGFLIWLGISISHYRFRKAYIAQGRDLKDLKYRARFFPFGPIFAAILCSFVILGQNYKAFFGASIDWTAICVAYIGLPLFFILYLGYKYIHKTKLVPLKECNFNKPEN